MGLTTITFAEGSQLTTIGDVAFYFCRNLTSINIPASVTAIGTSAFYYCINLTSISIPADVTSIGSGAFRNWTAGQTITVQGKANQAAADKAWGADWRKDCKAAIKYVRR